MYLTCARVGLPICDFSTLICLALTATREVLSAFPILGTNKQRLGEVARKAGTAGTVLAVQGETRFSDERGPHFGALHAHEALF